MLLCMMLFSVEVGGGFGFVVMWKMKLLLIGLLGVWSCSRCILMEGVLVSFIVRVLLFCSFIVLLMCWLLMMRCVFLLM